VAITLQRDFDASARGLRYLTGLLCKERLNHDHRFEVESRLWAAFSSLGLASAMSLLAALFGYG